MKVFVTGTRGIPNVMGGVETHCEELFPGVAAKGIDVTIARRASYIESEERREQSEECCGRAQGAPLQEWKGVKLVDIATPRKKSFEAIIHTFRAINTARRMGADIVHIHAIGPALLTPYARLRGMRVVFTHHGPDYDRDKWGRAAKMVLKLGERMGCMFADDVIVISNVIKDLIARKYGRTKRVHLIYNGVPEPDICSYPEYFKELGIEEGRYILGMCRFVPEKNLHHLVSAWQRLNEERTTTRVAPTGKVRDERGEWKLVLAGDTDFEDDYSRGLKEQAREAGVVLTGFIRGRKLHSLLTHCAAYCLPSSHEGLPIALLEAMSYGAPVIVSDIPANVEVGLPADCYFPVGDSEALAAKLRATIANPQARQTYDMTKYDWDAIADQVTEVYNHVISTL